ncbi:MAG TPA: phosphopantetheine-binding protein [Burkholderiales bacterium]|jgi:acyl carrier protein|nr:phosphopantetheine-binding protein [Burkholderiales bacterium]
MNRDEVRDHLVRILQRLAPDIDLGKVGPKASLRRALAVDSMDILNFVTALHEELGVDVPEQDYGKIDTLDGCVDYVVAALAGRERAGHPGAPR